MRKVSLPFAAGWEGGLVSWWEVICSPLWARNAKVTPTALVSGFLKRILKAWKAVEGNALEGRNARTQSAWSLSNEGLGDLITLKYFSR